jgi:hypothetical protein
MEIQTVQKWYLSPVTLTGIFVNLMSIAKIFLYDREITAINIIGTAIIAIVSIYAAANNPTNPIGFGANEVKK